MAALSLAALEEELRALQTDNLAKAQQLSALVTELGLSWGTCGKCGTLFDPNARKCPVCGEGAGASPAGNGERSSTWTCPACTSPNPMESPECSECSADRPTSALVASTSSSSSSSSSKAMTAPTKPAAVAAAPTPAPPNKCPSCMTVNAPGARECTECGSSISPPVSSNAGNSRVAVVAASAAVSSVIDLGADGKRESLTHQRAVEIFSSLPPNEATHVRLSTKSFGLGAAKVASEFLKGHASTLTVADFSDIIAGRPTDEALEVLTLICGALADSPVAHLDLSDNALGERGVRALSPLLSSLSSQLETLSFRNNGLSELSMSLLADALGTPNIKKLHFYSNMSGDGGAAAVGLLIERMGQGRSTLTDFCMSSCRVRESGGLSLARALAFNRQLQVLDLSDAMFGDKGGVALGEALGKMTQLTQLVLKDTGLKGAGLNAVIDALNHARLEILDLSSLELGPKGAARLASRLENLPALKQLKVGENELEDKGASALARAKFGPRIELLDVRDNDISAQGALELASSVKSLPNFSLLHLDGNDLKPEVQHQMKGVLGAQRVSFEGSDD